MSQLIEKFMQYSRKEQKWVPVIRVIIINQKTGKVGSPLKAKKVIKDDPYLQGIL